MLSQPTAVPAADKAQPKDSIHPTSREWPACPLSISGVCLGTPHFPAQPALSQLPCRVGEAAVGMEGAADFLERPRGPAEESKCG